MESAAADVLQRYQEMVQQDKPKNNLPEDATVHNLISDALYFLNSLEEYSELVNNVFARTGTPVFEAAIRYHQVKQYTWSRPHIQSHVSGQRRDQLCVAQPATVACEGIPQLHHMAVLWLATGALLLVPGK